MVSREIELSPRICCGVLLLQRSKYSLHPRNDASLHRKKRKLQILVRASAIALRSRRLLLLLPSFRRGRRRQLPPSKKAAKAKSAEDKENEGDGDAASASAASIDSWATTNDSYYEKKLSAVANLELRKQLQRSKNRAIKNIKQNMLRDYLPAARLGEGV